MNCIKRIIVVFSMLLLVAETGFGGSRANTGGDPINFHLERMRGLMVLALEHFRDNYDANNAEQFNVMKDYCGSSGFLDAEQVKTCIDFIEKTVAAILDCNHPSRRTVLRVVKAITSEQLEPFYADYPGGRQLVSAFTRGGCYDAANEDEARNEIVFSYDSIRQMNGRDLFMTVYHEFGHKVLYNSRYLDDIEGVGRIENGQVVGMIEPAHKLLNAAGNALFHYGMREYPKRFRELNPYLEQDFFTCFLKFAASESIPFVVHTARHERDSENDYISSNRRPVAMGQNITSITEQFIPGQEIFLNLTFQEAGGCDAPDSDGDASWIYLYERESPSEPSSKLIGDVNRSYNFLCPNRRESFVVESWKYPALKIKCDYEGRRSL